MAIINVPTAIATNVVGTITDDLIYSIVDPTVGHLGGNQTLYGGLGNDTYILGNAAAGAAGDTVIELAGDGTDTVMLFTNVNGTYTLANNVENLISRRFTDSGTTGSTANQLNGNSLNNVITVNDGPFGSGGAAETLDGGLGNDTMAGGLGNDLYIVDSALDTIIESNTGNVNGVIVTGFVNGVVLAGFVDSVQSSVTYTLGANVENLTLTGALDLNGTGNALPNAITGNAGNNVLDGGEGNDTLASGGGDDTMRGGGGNDVLDGVTGAGNITMDGGLGNDIFRIDDAGGAPDNIIADAGGVDLVQFTSSAAFSSYTLPAFIENVMNMTAGQAVTLTGNALANNLYGNTGADTLVGGAGDDILDGGAGADSLTGGAGSDQYVVDNAGDVVSAEKLNEGTDTVYSSITWTLGANFERLILTGGGGINGIGNALDNVILGNSGANVLSGGTGNDTIDGGTGNDRIDGGAGIDTIDGGAGIDYMSGGAGNDTYTVSELTGTNPQTRDIVFELPGGGIDLVKSSVTVALLFDNVENLTLTGSANINGIGNALANLITGNAGDNVLDAGRDLFADTLIGGIGNDSYVIYGANDVVTEVANVLAGTAIAPGYVDNLLYRGTAAYTLAANVENIAIDTGVGNVNVTGNALGNVMTGSAGINTIDGGLGNDTIAGGGGNDILLGNAGKDTLDGQLGLDTMRGGLDDDTYVVDSANDIVDEVGGTGAGDTIFSFVHTINIDPGFNLNVRGLVENVTLGGGALNATGNTLANVLRGNELANTLAGGAGNDTYFVDLSDQVIEGGTIATGGNDTVNLDVGAAAITVNVRNGVAPTPHIPSGELWNVENVTLTGTGNSNVIVQRVLLPAPVAVVNILTGNDGNNLLNAADGADTMAGGMGDDTYYVDNAGDRTIELAGQGTDTVFSTVTWTLQGNTENLELIGTGATVVNGTGNALGNFIRGNGGANTLAGLAGNDVLDGGGGNDTMNGADGDDTYWVDAPGDVVIDLSGADTVVSTFSGAGGVTLAAGIETLVLYNDWAIPPAVMNATGNLADNRIVGNFSNNLIDGGGGSDTFDFNIAGTLSAADTLIGGLNADLTSNDTLLANVSSTITVNALEIEMVTLRADVAGANGDVSFTNWSDIRAVNFTGSAGNLLTVNGAPHTGFVNNAVSGTPLVFALEDFDATGGGNGVTINADTTAAATDVLNLAIRDSGLNTMLNTGGWETIRINHQPSPSGAVAANTLDLSGLAANAANNTVLEVTGFGGGQLNLINLAGGTGAGSTGGGALFNRDLQVSVVNFTDRLQVLDAGGGADTLQVNVRDASFWLDVGNGTNPIETLELNALAPLAPATANTSFVHLNEANNNIDTILVGSATPSPGSSINFTIDGIRAADVDAGDFEGALLNMTAEGSAARTWTGPDAVNAVIFSFTGGNGNDTFDFDATPGMIDGMDLVNGGPGGNDTVNVDITGMVVSGTAMTGGLHLANIDTVNMLNTFVAVVDLSAMTGGNVVMSGSGGATATTIHGLPGDFDGTSLTGSVTIYANDAGGHDFSNFASGTTYTLFGSQADGETADTFNFGTTLDSADFVQAYDFDTNVPDTLSAQLAGATYAPTILGVESITLTGAAGPANTFNAANVVGAVTWTLSGAQTLTLSGLNGVAGGMTVNAAGITGGFTVTGSIGADTITGGTGVANTINGGEGDDVITGGNVANNVLNGDGGDDTITGGTLADTISGGDGDDSLTGGTGLDTLLGGDGQDVLISFHADNANDSLDGGLGTNDAVDYNTGAAAITILVTAPGTGTATGTNYGTDQLTGIEQFRGSAQADTITGSTGHGQLPGLLRYSEVFTGRGGNDIINGGGPQAGDSDFVNYNTGTTRVFVNLGGSSVTVNGQTVAANRATDITGSGAGAGTDTLSNIDGAFGGSESAGDILIGGSTSQNLNGVYFESFRGNAGDDIIAGNAGALSNALGGTGTVDLTDRDRADYQNDPGGVVADLRLGYALDGFGGTDTLFDITHVKGSAFDDQLLGGNAMNDSYEDFEGMDGDDHIDGGSGFDVARYSNATAAINVNLATGIAQDGMGGTDALFNIEAVEGSDFNDSITGSGTLLAVERFDGRGGDDTINGGLGEDRVSYNDASTGVNVNLATGIALDGTGGTDTLTGIEQVSGSSYNDTLVGNALANRLFGGATLTAITGATNNDTLTGGGGADTFAFSPDSFISNTQLDAINNLDVLTDFVSGLDKLELDDAFFTAFTAGNPVVGGTQPGAQFVQGPGAVAADGNDFLVYDTTTRTLYYDAGGNVGPPPVAFVMLTAGFDTLLFTDFTIV